MKKHIVIFSGTTEGRLLAESFAAAGVPVVVCVATGYGREVMKEDPLVKVHMGRMDEEEMLGFFRGNQTDMIFDATHPYAVEVSRNIKGAAEKLSIPYKRIERERKEHEDAFNVTEAGSVTEAVELLSETDGNILLTTGSKELMAFKAFKDRLYVRVLPSVEALRICDEAGIEKSHILAEQGPFSYEENLAVMKRFDISVLVTKNSGTNGGYDEKLKAAEVAGVKVITIEKTVDTSDNHTKKQPVHIAVIGAGCGNDTLTLESINEIRHADLIIGSKRLLNYGLVRKNPCCKREAFMPEDIIRIIIEENSAKVAVLFSGDTGFYSGAAGLFKVLPEDADVKVCPGISSVQALAARLHLPYDHAVVRSYHGVPFDAEDARHVVLKNQVSFFLMSGRNDAVLLADIARSTGAEVYAGVDIGTENEQIQRVTSDEVPDGRLFIIAVKKGL